MYKDEKTQGQILSLKIFGNVKRFSVKTFNQVRKFLNKMKKNRKF